MDALTGNLQSLAKHHMAAYEAVASQKPDPRFSFVTARNGGIVPVIDIDDRRRYLHSRVDPFKEGERFCSTYPDSGAFAFLGLGAGYFVRPFLRRKSTEILFIIDFNASYLSSLLSHVDLRDVFDDPRTVILVSANPETLSRRLLSEYIPYLHGDLSVVPLRQRMEINRAGFDAIQSVFGVIRGRLLQDVSTQSKFGLRWIKNILSNAGQINTEPHLWKKAQTAHITAAGPSLEGSIDHVRLLNRKDTVIIATDTSLPLLVASGITPDYAVTIDCQHHSYHHFLAGIPGDTHLVTALSSPPMLARLKKPAIFAADGHPFSRFLCSHWRRMQVVDTSGGNVTYAAVSLAAAIGASRVVLHGADFSYPDGKPYARETYVYPLFHSRQTRYDPLESQCTKFIFHYGSARLKQRADGFSYTTDTLEAYRNALISYAASVPIELFFFPDTPVESALEQSQPFEYRQSGTPESSKTSAQRDLRDSWRQFLSQLVRSIDNLPLPETPVRGYFEQLNPEQHELVNAMLPLCPYLKSKRANSPIPGFILLRQAFERTRQMAVTYLSDW